MNRRVEVKVGETWEERSFAELRPGDTFRMWDRVVEDDYNKTGVAVAGWACESEPEWVDGVLGCPCRPALDTDDKPISAVESADHADADKSD